MTDNNQTSNSDDQTDSFEHWLQSQLYRWDCPDPDTLGDYHLGQLPTHQHAIVEAHLRECVRCRQEIDLLTAFLNQNDDSQAPEVTNLTPARPPVKPDMVTRMNRPTQYAAIRGDGDLQTRLSFDLLLDDGSSEQIELLLSVSQQVDDYRLNGLLSMSAAAEALLIDALVEIWQAETLLATVFIDDLGGLSAALPELKPFMLRITIKGRTLFTGQVEFE